MGLDITFREVHPVLCPDCGAHVIDKEVDVAGSAGRIWYDILEKFGYYVPHAQRSEENAWYGKDMKLSYEQAKELYRFVKENRGDIYYGSEVAALVAQALVEGDSIVINADW